MSRGIGSRTGPSAAASNAQTHIASSETSQDTAAPSVDGASIVQYQPKDRIYQQGDVADAVFLLREGRVKLTATSRDGKEGVLGLLSSGSFLGEGCLHEASRRLNTATVMTPSTVLRIRKETMVSALQTDQAVAATFVLHLLARQSRIEEDLLDHLFNCSEKRLARALLLLAGIAQPLVRDVALPHLTQETLAEIVGTTRSRVSFFMNRFRLRGFVDYDRARTLTVRHSLLTVVRDEPIVRDR
ncbi:MAG: Crp/Fnr family transcriptional regulator [Vicinamibacterales bacterium]